MLRFRVCTGAGGGGGGAAVPHVLTTVAPGRGRWQGTKGRLSREEQEKVKVHLRLVPMIRGATGEVGEITFGYPFGLGEIVICWRGQVKPLVNSPPSTLPLFSLNPLLSQP